MPQNLLIRKSDGAAKLGDVMLAKALEGNAVQDVTESGELVGNIYYMAPERTLPKGDVDGRSDLYALGATVYHYVVNWFWLVNHDITHSIWNSPTAMSSWGFSLPWSPRAWKRTLRTLAMGAFSFQS